MNAVKVLYLTYVDLASPAKSGSALRPQKMLEALREISGELRVVDGKQNDYHARKNACAKVRTWLRDWTPDLCYIEPPSGPLFFECDRALLRLIHRKRIPIGIFYRDAYWRFPEAVGSSEKGLKSALKRRLIVFMQKRV